MFSTFCLSRYFQLKKVPSRIKVPPLPFQQIELHRVPFQTLKTGIHITKVAITVMAKISFSAAIIELIRMNRYDWNPKIYGFSTFQDLAYYYLLGLGISFLLESFYTIAAVISCLYFKIDFVPVMTNP